MESRRHRRQEGARMNCQWCDEEIKDGEACPSIKGGHFHHECAARVIVGSVGHQLHLWSCHGGDLEDPKHMTRREAAQMAFMLLKVHKGCREMCFPETKTEYTIGETHDQRASCKNP